MTTSHPVRPLPSSTTLLTALFLCPATGCWLFGGGGHNAQSPAALDTVEAYRSSAEAGQYAARVAELELVELRQNLSPVFDPGTRFLGDGEGTGWLVADTTLILDGVEDDRFAVQATGISPNLSREQIDLFVLGSERAEIGVGDLDGTAFFGFEELLAVPLIKADSFDAHIGQLADTRAGLRFCFFSKSMTNCEGGYEFAYDEAQFHTYHLKRPGDDQSLCSYEMTTSNHQISTNITVDLGANAKIDPDIRISAHNGYIRVVFNGHEICDVKGQSMTGGYFLVGEAHGIHTFDIDLNTGSSTFYAPVSSLVDVSLAADSLEPRQGTGYEQYNYFVSDYNALAAALAGEAFPETFHHEYFAQLLGKEGADEAFELAAQTDQIDAYLSYLQELPFNAHRREIEDAIWRLATASNTAQDYRKYEAQYPDSDRRLEVRRHLADLEWSEMVSKGTATELSAYVAEYPERYYRGRAEALLAHVDYRTENRSEVTRVRKLLAQAQKTVDKSPITSGWDVTIVDFVDGNIHFNLNRGPTMASAAGTQMDVLFVREKQQQAHEQTCELLQKRHSEVESCMYAWSGNKVRSHDPVPIAEAIEDAITRLYLPALTNGKELDRERLLELLAALGETDPGEQFRAAIFMAEAYLRLGMKNEAIYWFYRFARTAVNASDVNYYTRALTKLSEGLADDPDFRWVIDRYGEK